MEETRIVTWKEFKNVIAYLLLQQQQHAELVTAVVAVLVEQKAIPQRDLVKAMETARNAERSRKMREAIASLADSPTIEDILRSFEGSVQ
jgi:hypothetical protein